MRGQVLSALLLVFAVAFASSTDILNATKLNTTHESNYNYIKSLFIDPEIEAHGSEVQLDWSSIPALWDTLHRRYQPFYFMLVFYSFMTISYWLGGLFFIVIEQLKMFEHLKIHQGTYNTWATYGKCFSNLVLNYVCVILPNLLPGWLAFQYLGMGWDQATFPSLFTFVWQTIFCFVGEDFFQYFFHRLLHVPFLYKKVHKLHHEFQSPFALAGSYSHPFELVFLGLCTFAPAFIIRPHLITFYCWIWIRQMDAVIEHCGYRIANPLHWLPGYGGIPFHDYHHTAFTSNYASRFTYLDKLFNTYREPPLTSNVTNKEKNKLK